MGLFSKSDTPADGGLIDPNLALPEGWIQEAQGELERMSRAYIIFDRAQKAISVLANFQQVNGELARVRDGLAKEVDSLTAQRDAAQAEITAAKQQASGILADAKAGAEDVQTRAADVAAKIEAEAQDMRKKAYETVAAAAREREIEEGKRDDARAELKQLNATIAEAKQTLAGLKAFAAA